LLVLSKLASQRTVPDMPRTLPPHRNRVTPEGEIVAVPDRGLFLGNRGVLHDERQELRRAWQVRRWITCRLEWKGRRRELLQPRRYTELFFLDEATALAAGHRPCAECRYRDYRRFRGLWMTAHGGAALGADDLDRVLHSERLTPGRRKRVHEEALADLPDGTMIREDGVPWLVWRDTLLAWTPGGYAASRPRRGRAPVTVLTPRSTVAVLRAGYDPIVHPSCTVGQLAGGAQPRLTPSS
jgi:hypothetical protein